MIARRMLLAGLVFASAAAAAQQLACTRAEIPQGFTLTCTAPAATTPTTGPAKPAEPPPPPPAASACAGVSAAFLAALEEHPPLDLWTIQTFRMPRALTDQERACARERNVPGATLASRPPPGGEPASGPQGPAFDVWTHRDLTGTHGNVLRFQGSAGDVARYELREPAGKLLELTVMEQVPIPGLGHCRDFTLEVQGQRDRSYQPKLLITSTGNDPALVTLHCAGAAGIQLNPR